MTYTEFRNCISENKRIKVLNNLYLKPSDIVFTNKNESIAYFFESLLFYVRTGKTFSKYFTEFLTKLGVKKQVFEELIGAYFSNTTLFNYIFWTCPNEVQTFEDMIYYSIYFHLSVIYEVKNFESFVISDTSKNQSKIYSNMADDLEKYINIMIPKTQTSITMTTILSNYVAYGCVSLEKFLSDIDDLNKSLFFNIDEISSIKLDNIYYDLSRIKFGEDGLCVKKDGIAESKLFNDIDKLFYDIEQRIIREHKYSRNVRRTSSKSFNMTPILDKTSSLYKDYKLETYFDFISDKLKSNSEFFEIFFNEKCDIKINIYELDFIIKMDVLGHKRTKKDQFGNNVNVRRSVKNNDNLNSFVSAFVKKVLTFYEKKNIKHSIYDILYVAYRYLLIYRSFDFIYTCNSSFDYFLCKKLYTTYSNLLFIYSNDKLDRTLKRDRDYFNCLRLNLGLSLGKQVLSSVNYPIITDYDELLISVFIEENKNLKSSEFSNLMESVFVWFEPSYLYYFIFESFCNEANWTINIPNGVKNNIEKRLNRCDNKINCDIDIVGQDIVLNNKNNQKMIGNLITQIDIKVNKDAEITKYLSLFDDSFDFNEDFILKQRNNTELTDIQTLLKESGYIKSIDEIKDRLSKLKVHRKFDESKRELYHKRILETGDIDSTFTEVFGNDRTEGSARGLKIAEASKVVKEQHKRILELEAQSRIYVEDILSYETENIRNTAIIECKNKIIENLSNSMSNIDKESFSKKEIISIITSCIY